MSDSKHEPDKPDDIDGDDEEADASPLAFTPAQLRYRRDGWTPERQQDFIVALAETGCVEDAARRVGKAVSGAYELRNRMESHSFRLAWDAALDMAIDRVTDAAVSRAIHGVPVPH